MRLTFEKVRTSQKYKIGYIPIIDQYVLAVTNERDGRLYDDYYMITADTYAFYKRDVKRLDFLAKNLHEKGHECSEYLFSDFEKFNSEGKQNMYFTCRDSQKELITGDFERI